MEKQRIASIRLRDIASASVKRTDDGQPVLDVRVNAAQYQIGYDGRIGKSRLDFVSPNWNIQHWSQELELDCHFCFVDTNSIRSSVAELSQFSHATGIYVFQLEHFDTQRDGEWTNLTWKPDWRRSVIRFEFTAGSDEDAEQRGWAFALDQLEALHAARAKIFVDKHQNELGDLSKSLRKGWQYYYVSSDRGKTLFNLIFRRLDKAIKIVSSRGPSSFRKVDIERYLMGNADHLTNSVYPTPSRC